MFGCAVDGGSLVDWLIEVCLRSVFHLGGEG